MNLGPNATHPATSYTQITPNDTVGANLNARGLYIGGGGSLVIVDPNGNDVSFSGVLGGAVYPFAVSWVKATGTTATAIVGLR